jgi:hypothetical protein
VCHQIPRELYIISLTYYCNLIWALFIAVLCWYLQPHGSVHPSCHVSWLQEYHKGLSADLVNPKGKLPILGCVHKILGVPPVCTSIQLIITINVLTARGKNIGYLKGSLVSQHWTECCEKKNGYQTRQFQLQSCYLIPFPLSLIYFRSTYILGTTEILRSGHFAASPKFRWRQFWVY